MAGFPFSVLYFLWEKNAMRIERKFGQRSQAEKREPRRKFFLAFEGENAEVQYFSGLIENKDFIGIDTLIEIVPLLRSYNEKSWSNPKKFLRALIDYFEEDSSESITINAALNKVIDLLIDEKMLDSVNPFAVEALHESVKAYFVGNGFSLYDTLDINDACVRIAAYLGTNSIATSLTVIEQYIKSQQVVFAPGFDRVCLIADRDKQSFKPDQFDFVQGTCEEKGYSFYITNPCFELWLLMHFDEILDYDRELMFKNPKSTPKSKKRFLEQKLSIHMRGYNKEGVLRFDVLKSRIDHAIRNEKHFCENICDLKTNLGCNIGKLIEEMKKDISYM